MPEFTTLIGKIQHQTHAYSVDIHTMKVLQSSMNNPLYEKLTDKNKSNLKMAIILHDSGKKGGVIDRGHAVLSAKYIENALNKFKLSKKDKTQIKDIVSNHHWFEAYNKGLTTPDEIAGKCKTIQNLIISEIFATADLENVSEDFCLKITNTKDKEDFYNLMAEKFKPIEKCLVKKFDTNCKETK